MAYVNTGTTNFQTLVQDLVLAKAETELRARLVHANPDAYVPGRLSRGRTRFGSLATLILARTLRNSQKVLRRLRRR